MSEPKPDFDAIAERYFTEVVNGGMRVSESRQREILSVYLEIAFISGFDHGEVSALKSGRRSFGSLGTDGLMPDGTVIMDDTW